MINLPLFQLLRLSLGTASALDHPFSAAEWEEVFKQAKKHALIGVLYSAVEPLEGEWRPERRVVMRWYTATERLKNFNKLVDDVAARVVHTFKVHGIRTCILKGQGNALLYPVPARRNPGDVDVWVDMAPREASRYVHKYTPGTKACYHHIDFPVHPEVDVEVHYRPSYLCAPWRNRRLQRMFNEMREQQFSHIVTLSDDTGRQMAVPTAEFNAIFQLVHLYRHIFEEGVGLRQLVDYYYVLMQLDEETRRRTMERARRLGIYRFARAVMYVMSEALGVEPQRWLCEPDANAGDFLLAEIMQAGDFGHSDPRYDFAHESQAQKFLRKLRRNFRFVRFYAEEVLCEPFFRVFHWCYRKSMP